MALSSLSLAQGACATHHTKKQLTLTLGGSTGSIKNRTELRERGRENGERKRLQSITKESSGALQLIIIMSAVATNPAPSVAFRLECKNTLMHCDVFIYRQQIKDIFNK